MKNKISRYVVLLAVLPAMLGCEALDRLPQDRLAPETFFRNRSECEMWTNNYYTIFPDAGTIYGNVNDDVVKDALPEHILGIRQVPTTSGSWNWDKLRDMNVFMKYSGNCADETVRAEFEALTRFFRAYFYYEKVIRYGDVPWVDYPMAANDPQLKKPRDPRELVMQKMLEDIDFAIDYLPESKSLYRVTRWTALALKTRFCLFEGTFRKYHGLDDYEKYLTACAEAGREFIQNSGYSIYNIGDTPYRDLFASLNAIGTEIILARSYGVSGLAHNANGYTTMTTQGRAGLTRNVANMYLMSDGSPYTQQAGWDKKSFADECKGRDKRFAQSIRTPGYTRVGASAKLAPRLDMTFTGYHLTKYVGEAKYDAFDASITDMPLFRAAEVYLNYAEAKAELGTITQADIDMSIKPLRNRAGVSNLDLAYANANPDPYLSAAGTGYPNVSGTHKGVILEIRRERTVELLMEGFRSWDILRWKEGKRYENPYTGMYFPGVGNYDLDGDGTYDVCIYNGDQPSLGSDVVYMKLGKDVILTEDTKGNILRFSDEENRRTWDENKDYLYPIPLQDRLVTKGVITQNPGWDDGLSF